MRFFLVFFWLEMLLGGEVGTRLLICSCLGLSCLRFLYFAALTYWPAWLILCLNFCAFYSWLFCPVSTQLEKKNLYSPEDQLGPTFEINVQWLWNNMYFISCFKTPLYFFIWSWAWQRRMRPEAVIKGALYFYCNTEVLIVDLLVGLMHNHFLSVWMSIKMLAWCQNVEVLHFVI